MSDVVWSLKPYEIRYVLERSKDGSTWVAVDYSEDLEYLKSSGESWASDGYFVRILDRMATE